MIRGRISGAVFLLSFCMMYPADLLPAQEHPLSVPEKEYGKYLQLNEDEERLAGYRDSEKVLRAKVRQLHYINRSRERNGQAALELDIHASRVANRMALQAAEQGFMGHYNLQGETPYHRYSFACGTAHVSENAASVHTTGSFPQNVKAIERMMRESHDSFMAEKAPRDGHRQTVLNPHHTAVGIGTALTSDDFRYYEEYLDRYLEFIKYEKTASAGESVTFRLRPLSDNHLVQAVILFFEPFPQPITGKEASSRTSYPDYTDEVISQLWPPDLSPGTDGIYEFTLTFPKPGLYYLHVYLGTEPFHGGRFSTEGKIQASGLVIRVQQD